MMKQDFSGGVFRGTNSQENSPETFKPKNDYWKQTNMKI